MLRKVVCAMLTVIPMMGAASAQPTDVQGQPHVQGQPGYTNVLRTPAERKNDKDIDRNYQSTINGRPDAEKKNADPWGDVRSTAPPAAAKNKQ